MSTGEITSTISLAGLTMSGKVTRTEDGQISHAPTLAAAQAGSLTTRTSDTVGEATLGAEHGITTAQVVDVYWSGGVRYGVTVGTVDGTAVPLADSGAGDNLPAENTALTVAPRITIDTDFDGDLVTMIAAACASRAHLHFVEDDETSLLAVELTAGEPWTWASDSSVTNPLADAVVGKVYASCGAAAAAVVNLAALYDSAS